jgi:hypothetical protein
MNDEWVKAIVTERIEHSDPAFGAWSAIVKDEDTGREHQVTGLDCCRDGTYGALITVGRVVYRRKSDRAISINRKA